ncbi:hypothetical protein BDD43_3307 [Mucilaginibacter gracilis]|uniref:Uncharacterized protein n=1 Tax=Mucilaginibacter gracilis TaxID=423350 RepID=A0A495J2A7_9SPHI|nr:hypothetical protein [Mucilaginibacter gracilis]RKR83106.1 hypothetical protein BDD43_3307 [Mucilaginibacter gracilis]
MKKEDFKLHYMTLEEAFQIIELNPINAKQIGLDAPCITNVAKPFRKNKK